MEYTSIKNHLRPYKIVQRRRTTINHAFAAAIAPHDAYDEQRIRKAVELLDQNPDESLRCVYCDAHAQTWDHVFGTVRNSEFSGHGYRLGNLVPSCKDCNSSKGNKNWKDFMSQLAGSNKLSASELLRRQRLIEDYIRANAYSDESPLNCPEFDRLQEIRSKVFELLAEADMLAQIIRENNFTISR
ncbi:MAG: HNH endonuclease [Acidobacteria bacterium]|nr:HNH endonuclease [Acidobacteriota bacterium]